MTIIKAKKGIKFIAIWQCPCGEKNETDLPSTMGECIMCDAMHVLDVEEPELTMGTTGAIFGRCERCEARTPYLGDTCHVAMDDGPCGGNVQLLPVED